MFHRLFRFFQPEPARVRISDPVESAAVYRRMRWRVFLSITIGYSFFYTTRLSFSVVKKPLLDAGLLDAAQMGLIGSALLIAYGVGKTFNGFLADHANPRRLFATGLLVSAVANILFGLSGTFAMFLVIWGVNGWFQSVGVPVSGVVLSSWFSNSERGSRYSVWSTAHNLGEAITFTATAFLVGVFGWRAGFFGPGLVCIAVAAILYKTLADRPPTRGLPPVAEYTKDVSRRRRDDNRPTAYHQLEVLKNPFVWLIGMSSAFLYVARYAINDWGVLYLQMERGYSLAQAGFAVALFPLVGILGTILAGPISDRFFQARRAPASCGYGFLLIGALFVLLYAPAGQPWMIYAGMAVAGFAMGGQLVFLGGLVAMDLCSERASGAALGIIGGFSYLGAAIQDFLSGRMIEASRLAGGPALAGVATTTYDFSQVKFFWFGSAFLSLLFALSLWRAEASNRRGGVEFPSEICSNLP